MRRIAILVSWCTAMVVGAACSDEGTVEQVGRSTGVALTADLAEGTDVGGMHFLITPCRGGDPVVDETVPLEGMDLPAGLVEFDGDRLAPSSTHRFADYFISLTPGCYDVVVEPMTPTPEGWTPSFDCVSAFQDGVIVEGEKTTEIMLISQCVGDEIGGLDAIAALNREPEIVSLTYAPSKFVGDCDGTVVCVTATDLDCDPLEIVWTQLGGPGIQPTPVSLDRSGCTVTECVRYQPGVVAAYELEVAVFDLLISGEAMARIEDWLAAHGYPSDSHASLSFPLYSGVVCPEPPEPPEPPLVECTRTYGYWKTHHAGAMNPSQNIPWPGDVNETDELCGETLLAVMQEEPAGGDAFIILAHQYLAALLNVEAGAPLPWVVGEVLGAAREMLELCEIKPGERHFALMAAGALDLYNNGWFPFGPPHCDCQCP